MLDMQTFLPYPGFAASAKVLDRQRLGKQRVEAMQIDNALEDEGNGWHRHPAVQMWKGYRLALRAYANAIISEWVARGYVNNIPLYDVPEDQELVLLSTGLGYRGVMVCDRPVAMFPSRLLALNT